jgi:sodium/hydrogen antiporter
MELALLAFSATLLVAVLFSDLAERSVISTAVIFLVAGFVLGPSVLHLFRIPAREGYARDSAQLALLTILFTDGLRITARELREGGNLAARALAIALPLTLFLTALTAHWLLHLGWIDALLVGTALSPTDPVFAAAVIGREEVPSRIRAMLNVESGANDGLALPVILWLIGRDGGAPASLPSVLLGVAGGVAVGVLVPAVSLALEHSRFFASARHYEPLHVLADGLLVYAITAALHLNPFLGIFAAGMTLALRSSALARRFGKFGELLAEIAKLGAVMVLGALITPELLRQMPGRGYLFVAIALVAVRPVALGVALWGKRIGGREFATVAWFGPKGFSSILYGLFLVHVPNGPFLLSLVALTVAISIVAHSSTDVLVSRWFHRRAPAGEHG